MTSLTSLVFFSSTNEHFEGKNCQMNFNVERKDVNEMTIKGYCYSFRKYSR